MSVGSFFREKNISIHAHQPLILGGTELYDITSKLDSYDHEILVGGGFYASQISIIDTLSQLEDWYENKFLPQVLRR